MDVVIYQTLFLGLIEELYCSLLVPPEPACACPQSHPDPNPRATCNLTFDLLTSPPGWEVLITSFQASGLGAMQTWLLTGSLKRFPSQVGRSGQEPQRDARS